MSTDLKPIEKKSGKYDALVLLTGGTDSTSLLYHVRNKNKNILALHFKTGLIPNDYELEAAKQISKKSDVPLQILDISQFVQVVGVGASSHNESLVLKFGINVIFSMTSAFAMKNNIPTIFVAFHKEDISENIESSPKFIGYLNEGIKLVGGNCEIVAPFHNWTKVEVLQDGIKHNAPLELSWSCISPVKNIQCGTCGACKSRREAFKKAEIKDLAHYAVN